MITQLVFYAMKPRLSQKQKIMKAAPKSNLRKLPKPLANENQQRERVKRGLEGLWEYRCKTHDGRKTENDASTFADNEVSRGGVIHIVVHNNGWAGLSASVTGHRLWAKKATDKNPFELEDRLIWEAKGDVVVDNVGLRFTYFTGERFAGRTTDTVYINDNDRGFYLSPGKFVHIRKDGKQVSGEVEFRKMVNARDLRWCPKNLRFVPD
jgi:hypothetical protein